MSLGRSGANLPLQGVVFDLDGTLLDTLEDLYLSTNAALTKYGFPERTLEDILRIVKDKRISGLFFESHWMYRSQVAGMRRRMGVRMRI